MASAARWRRISAIAPTTCCTPACRCSTATRSGTRPMRRLWADCSARGVAALLGQQLLGRDPGDRRHPVQLAGRDDQHPAAGAGFAARSRASRAPGHDRAAVAETYREVSDRFGVQVTSLYAMTETFAVTMFTPDDPESKGASAGRPRGLAEASDRQRRGRSAADAARSARSACGPASPASSCRATTRCPRPRCATRRDLWLHTGDRGRLDRGRLSLFRRPQEGGDPPPWREHLRLRGRDADRQAPLRAGGRGGAGGFRAQRGRGDGLRRLPRRLHASARKSWCASPTRTWRISWCRASSISSRRCPRPPSEKIEKYKLKTWAEQNRRIALGPRGGRAEARTVIANG